ncbi:MAG: DUF885 domain-containing protein [Clostridia bacterium]|nr:DUF885 domain-containing protein [Clostridia bacterium]
MKLNKKKIILASILIFLLILGWWLVKLVWFKPTSINLFYERTLIGYALKDPQQMSKLGVLNSFGIKFFDDKLTDRSLEHELDLFRYSERELNILRSYDRSKQTKEQLISTDILDWFMENYGKGKEFMHYGFPVNNYLGVQKQLPEFMVNSHTIHGKKDAKNYIKRLSVFDTYFTQTIDSLKAQEQKGIIPPSYVISNTLTAMNNFISQSAEDNSLYTVFVDKLKGLKLDDDTKTRLTQDVKAEIENTVYPSYKRLINYYDGLLEKSKDYVGVYNLPEGEKYFRYMLRNYATLDITPEEAYNKLTSEVDKINSEIRRLGKKTITSENETGAISTLDDCQKVISDMYSKLPMLFGTLPKAKVQVQYYPDTGSTNSGFFQYNSSDMNGTKPATIFVPKDFASNNSYTMKWILYHEGVPGHHLQQALAREMKNIPNFRKIIGFSAFSEGWATYAQSIPWEYRITSDPNGEVEMLKTKLMHIGRAVIDIGVNYMRWTREDAIKYALENKICDEGSARFYSEYCTVYPGIECTYAIGYLKIIELRDEARAKLRNKFSIKDFHDAILEDGEMPLSLLEKKIKEYIDIKK